MPTDKHSTDKQTHAITGGGKNSLPTAPSQINDPKSLYEFLSADIDLFPEDPLDPTRKPQARNNTTSQWVLKELKGIQLKGDVVTAFMHFIVHPVHMAASTVPELFHVPRFKVLEFALENYSKHQDIQDPGSNPNILITPAEPNKNKTKPAHEL
ncbi:hypothetical protein C8Q75DRAFT_804398 [Abortiporus biennis]|nr:hypothetical protein C8Q75DRAFT_804398 [Abortiporus biennis]